jgi:mRNA-degrading endonuclease RelE of RelBE toxin-antitoxin system
MEIRKTPAVYAALRTLAEDERRKVFSLFDHLGNWENDAHLRNMAKPTTDRDIYVLNTSDDIRIFFDLDEANREIVVVDLARPSRFPVPGAASE